MIDDMLIGPVTLGNCTTGHNYLVQSGLPEQLDVLVWLHGLLYMCTFSMTEPLLIIPDLRCNISGTVSLSGGSVVAVPLGCPDVNLLAFVYEVG
jgi:hypothetical protein